MPSTGFDHSSAIPDVFVYVAIGAWGVVFVGMVMKLVVAATALRNVHGRE